MTELDLSLRTGCPCLPPNCRPQQLHVVALTKQTLGFYRDNSRPEAIDIGQLLEEVLAIYGARLQSKSIQVEKRYGRGVRVQAVAGELRQVFSNLVANSIEKKGGVKDVQEILGHTNPDTTAGVYMQPIAESVKQTLDAIYAELAAKPQLVKTA